MKLLVISSLTKIATANYIIHALQQHGHTLFVYSDVRNDLATIVGPSIVDVVGLSQKNNFNPDLALFIEGGTMQLFPLGLERLSCFTAWYGIDTHMDYTKHLSIARLFDVTFLAQKEYVDRLRGDGIKQVFWLPLGVAPELYPKQELERTYKVAYVGSTNPDVNPKRHKLLTAIRNTVQPVYIGSAPPAEMARIYSQALIVFNKSINNDINMRYFEAMGAGAVLLTDKINDNGVDDLFQSGKHYREYTDEKSLLDNIEFLSKNLNICKDIGVTANKLVSEKHTYYHRVQTLLESINLSTKINAPSPELYFDVFFRLNITSGLLLSVAGALRNMKVGRVKTRLNILLAYIITVMAVVVVGIDRLRIRRV